jgi:hypothetical protein
MSDTTKLPIDNRTLKKQTGESLPLYFCHFPPASDLAHSRVGKVKRIVANFESIIHKRSPVALLNAAGGSPRSEGRSESLMSVADSVALERCEIEPK